MWALSRGAQWLLTWFPEEVNARRQALVALAALGTRRNRRRTH